MTLLSVSKNLPPTLVRLSDGSPNGSVIFLPDVGGNVLYAQELVRALKGEFSFFGTRLSTNMAAQLQSLTVEGICKEFASDIKKANFERPVHLVGFSFAALLATETARQLSILDAAPERLWIIDMPATTQVGPKKIIRFIRLYIGRILSGKKRSNFLHKPGFVQLNLSNHPESYHEIIRSLYSILTTFKPRPWTGNATVVVSEDRKVSHNGPDELGWSKFILGDLKTCVAPGDHMSMLYDPNNAAVLAELIRTHLEADHRAPVNVPD